MAPPSPEPVRPARPSTVTTAFWLQLAAVIVLLALVGLVVVHAIRFDDQIDRAVGLVPGVARDLVAGERSGNVLMSTVLGVPALILAVWLAATALPVLRGSNTARILVFVAGGAPVLLALLQCGGGSFLMPLELFLPEGDDGYVEGEPHDADSRFLEALYGRESFDWVPLLGVIGVVVLLVLAVAMVLLLAVEPARSYFLPRTATSPPIGPPSGYALQPGGYLICPDPSAHAAIPDRRISGDEPSDEQSA